MLAVGGFSVHRVGYAPRFDLRYLFRQEYGKIFASAVALFWFLASTNKLLEAFSSSRDFRRKLVDNPSVQNYFIPILSLKLSFKPWQRRKSVVARMMRLSVLILTLRRPLE